MLRDNRDRLNAIAKQSLRHESLDEGEACGGSHREMTRVCRTALCWTALSGVFNGLYKTSTPCR